MRKMLIQLNMYIAFFLCIAGCTQTKKIPAYSKSDKTLKEAYKDAFSMGLAVNDAIVSGTDNPSQDIVVRHFNSITLENSMKAALINPQPGVFNFDPAGAFVAFREAHKMFIIACCCNTLRPFSGMELMQTIKSVEKGVGKTSGGLALTSCHGSPDYTV